MRDPFERNIIRNQLIRVSKVTDQPEGLGFSNGFATGQLLGNTPLQEDSLHDSMKAYEPSGRTYIDGTYKNADVSIEPTFVQAVDDDGVNLQVGDDYWCQVVEDLLDELWAKQEEAEGIIDSYMDAAIGEVELSKYSLSRPTALEISQNIGVVIDLANRIQAERNRLNPRRADYMSLGEAMYELEALVEDDEFRQARKQLSDAAEETEKFEAKRDEECHDEKPTVST